MRQLTQSDVVFMYTPSVDVARRYGATVVAWGGGPDGPDPDSLDRFRRQTLDPLRAEGIHYATSMWCLTAGAKSLHENAELREAVCRDLDGNPIAVPWLHDHVHYRHTRKHQ